MNDTRHDVIAVWVDRSIREDFTVSQINSAMREAGANRHEIRIAASQILAAQRYHTDQTEAGVSE